MVSEADIQIYKETQNKMRDERTLHDLHRYFEGCWVLGKRDPIIQNAETRMLTALLWGISGKSVCIRGESGSAKTKILNAVSSLFFSDTGLQGRSPELLLLNSSSAKGALTPDSAAMISQSKRCAIPELQNILTSQHLEAMIKLWMEDRPYIYTRSEFGRQQIRIILEPKPILTNLADGNEQLPELPVEMKRRVVSLPTFSNRELNEEVHHLKAINRMLPDEKLIKLTRTEVSGLRNTCRKAMSLKQRVINPGADIIRKAIPTNYTMSNTFIEYFFDVVEAVTKFNHLNRVSTDKYIYATPEDNFVSFLIAGDIFRDMSIGIQPIGKEIMEFIPKAEVWGDLISEKETDAVHIDEITDYLTEQGFSRSKKMLEYTMSRLVNTNFVRKLGRANKFYRTRDFDFKQTIDWKLLVNETMKVMKEHHGEVYGEYQENDLHTYTHPFTGNQENIPMTIEVYGGEIDETE